MGNHDSAPTSGGGMDRHSKVYVAGHQGLLGRALVRGLRAAGFTRLLLRPRSELDLRDQAAVQQLLSQQRPDHVFLAAARVGGIQANASLPASFLYDNLALQVNVIHQAWRAGVKRLMFLASSCSYPRQCPQPMQEQHLLSGPVEPTSRPYAVAKIAGVEQCWAYNRQHGTRFLAALPNTIYGPGDDYDLASCHVLPALIRRMHQARETGQPAVTLWGTGQPRRELIHCDDVASALLFLMDLPDAALDRELGDNGAPPLFNVGSGQDLSIAQMAALVAQVVGFTGELRWDTSRPDGAPRKLLDHRRLEALGWRPTVALQQGVEQAYQDFLEREAEE